MLMPSIGLFSHRRMAGLFGHKSDWAAPWPLRSPLELCLFLYGWRRAFVAGAMSFSAFVLLMSGSGSAFVVAAIPFVLLPPMFAYRKGHRAYS